MSFQAEAVVDLDTISANVAALSRHTKATLMPAVKANAYGHGMVPVAQACLAGGADRLGVATLDEAMTLRAHGITAPVLTWLVAPGLDLTAAIDADIDLSVGSLEQLAEVAEAVRHRPARIHLKVDTGMGRGGAPTAAWEELVDQAAKAQTAGKADVIGAFSHLACADEPDNPVTAQQNAEFNSFIALMRSAGIDPQWAHLANSAGLLAHPSTHHNLVRPGIAVYGYPPVPESGVALRPALRLRARLVTVKTLPAGHGIGYGRTYVTERETRVAIAPLGYADGISRLTSNRGHVMLGDRRCPVRGRVSMDQVAIDVSGSNARPGDIVEFFGPGAITADDWAAWSETIAYEVLTSIGPRIPRRYLGGSH